MLVNMRDLGGYATSDGRKVKTGKLYRAGELVALSPEEVSLLQQAGIQQVIDFRTVGERAQSPNDALPQVTEKHLDILGGDVNPNQLEQWFSDLSVEKVRQSMGDIYRQFVTSPVARAAYRQFLLDIQQGVSLFHCAAGKDRTGFAAAVVLKLLGVSEQEVLADYLATNASRVVANQRIADTYRAKGLNEDQLAALAIAYSVEADFLQASFEAMDDIYGGFEGFIREGLGLSTEEIGMFQDVFLD